MYLNIGSSPYASGVPYIMLMANHLRAIWFLDFTVTKETVEFGDQGWLGDQDADLWFILGF